MAAFVAGSMVVPVMARRIHAAYLVGAGLVFAAGGLAVLTQVNGPSGLAVIVIGSIIYSLGFSPVVILATDLIVGSAPAAQAGAPAGISETSPRLGGAPRTASPRSIGGRVS